MANYQQMKEQSKQRRTRALLAQACLAVLIVGLLFGNSYAVVKLLHGQPVLEVPAFAAVGGTSPEGGGVPAVPPASGSQAQSGGDGQDVQAPRADEPWNTTEQLPQTINNGATVQASSKLLAVPENGKVSLDYFRDALFIGDSVTEGFALYEPLKEEGKAIIYSARGASPQFFVDNGGGTINKSCPTQRDVPAVWDAISAEAPGKVYLLMGANAILNTPDDDRFLKFYGDLMDKIAQTFPGVPVYVQGVTPVTRACAEWNDHYSLTRLHTLNNKVAAMALARGFYYVDTHEALADAEGYLPDDIGGYPASNGMHMHPAGYLQWVEYLQRHTVYSPANLPYVEAGEGPYM